MKNIAVLTGDVINSRKSTDVQELISKLRQVFEEIRQYTKGKYEVEIFRGDSFQLVLEHPENAVLIALLIRIGLRSKTTVNTKAIQLNNLWDTRISIGIGSGEITKKITESNDEAFQLSGLEFDKLKKNRKKLAIDTIWEKQNSSLAVIISLLDITIDRWTKLTCEVVYENLLKGLTQAEMAKQLKISQPAVHKRMTLANITVIKNSIDYISDTIESENSK